MSDSTSAMPNGFDILKKMWEAFSPPATFTSPLTQLMQSAAPLLDPNEIENRIAEMRAVEQWLTLNLNVLRSTIQAFEVQRATYATLRAFGSGGFGASSASADTGAASGTSEGSEAPSFGQASGFWRSPFGATEPAQDVEASQGEPEPEPAAEASAGAQEAPSEAGDTSSPFAQAGQAYAALDPSMWFNAMRAQFDQIAAAAQAAGMSAAQMTEAAAAQMSDAAAKATHTTSTKPSGAGAAKTSKASKTAGKTGAAGKAASGATKAAGKTAAAKRAPASKKPPAKSAAAKTSAKTSTKAAAKTARTAAGSDDTASSAPAAGKTSGKQGSWKW
ncbi:PhaM family polyhydroxyalkanoate granule multifunctional regulatory protein [Pandoraea pnomenusa]|uniref:PhaM family polyhydroxyalkanoate granule multifunctional regulatory protein n=1 Tax=Pandoraea pnomenusa TaxID=93220 RepID=UPI003340D4AB